MTLKSNKRIAGYVSLTGKDTGNGRSFRIGVSQSEFDRFGLGWAAGQTEPRVSQYPWIRSS